MAIQGVEFSQVSPQQYSGTVRTISEINSPAPSERNRAIIRSEEAILQRPDTLLRHRLGYPTRIDLPA